MRFFVFLLLFYGAISNTLAGGLHTWSQKTPYGNEIWYESAHPKSWNYILCKQKVNTNDFADRDNAKEIEKWYFYRKKIIGTLNDGANAGFFVFDELNCQASYFQKEENFIDYLKENNLEPLIWTRWYDSYYGGWLYTNVNGTFQHVWNLIFGIILAPLLLWFLFKLIRSKFDFKLIRNKLFIVLILILITTLFLDIYPESF